MILTIAAGVFIGLLFKDIFNELNGWAMGHKKKEHEKWENKK